MLNGMQLCSLIRFIGSLASNRKEQYRLLTAMHDAMIKDCIEHYSCGDEAAEETDDAGSTEEQWIEKARSRGVKDVR